MKRIIGAAAIALALASCSGGTSSDAGPATTEAIDAPAGDGLTTCPPLLESGDALTADDIEACLDLGAVTQNCGDVTTAVVVVDGQAWGLAPGEPAEQVADGFDPRDLCP